MACEIPGKTVFTEPGVSGANLTGLEGTWVKTPAAWVTAATGSDGIGVLCNGGNASGDLVSVAVGGEVMVIFGDTVVKGEEITNEVTTCRTIPKASGTKLGIALSGGGDGEWGRILIER